MKFQYRVQILSGIDNATEPVWEGEAYVELEDPEDEIEIGAAIITYLRDFVTEWDDRIQPTFKIISRSEVEQAARRPIDIEVSERLMDHWWDNGVQRPKYYARIKDTVAWTADRSVESAVNSLVRTHPELFGISRETCDAQPDENYCNNQGKWGIRVLYLGLLSR